MHTQSIDQIDQIEKELNHFMQYVAEQQIEPILQEMLPLLRAGVPLFHAYDTAKAAQEPKGQYKTPFGSRTNLTEVILALTAQAVAKQNRRAESKTGWNDYWANNAPKAVQMNEDQILEVGKKTFLERKAALAAARKIFEDGINLELLNEYLVQLNKD